MKCVPELPIGRITPQGASESREKHQHRAISFSARNFSRIVINPIVIGGLRVVRQRLISNKNHLAARAFHHVPFIALKHRLAVEGAAERARAVDFGRLVRSREAREEVHMQVPDSSIA